MADNPVYIQQFVSKMMSKEPLENMSSIRDATGIEFEANLGYDPYWVNLIDRPWELKCQRCSEVFKRYDTVCAVDGTGDVTVNISMCNLMRQNCLAGIAHGNSTGVRNDFQGNYFVVANGWARVAFLQYYDAIIQLSSHPDMDHDFYEIEIDGWYGWWSGIWRNDNVMSWYHTVWYRALYTPPQWTEFVMRWNQSSGWFLITRQSYENWTTDGFYLNITDPNPFPIKYIAVSGAYGYNGSWIIKDFIVTQLNPCSSSVVARPLQTSPTSVTEILHSMSYHGYFTRIQDAGLDLQKISFLTREEY